MIITVYFAGLLLLFLAMVSLGSKRNSRDAFLRSAGVFAFLAAALILLAPLRIDAGSIGPTSFPYDERAQRLTQILFVAASFSVATVFAAIGVQLLGSGQAIHQAGPDKVGDIP